MNKNKPETIKAIILDTNKRSHTMIISFSKGVAVRCPVVVVVAAGQAAGEARCPESPVADGTSHSPQQMGGREGRERGAEGGREDESERPPSPFTTTTTITTTITTTTTTVSSSGNKPLFLPAHLNPLKHTIETLGIFKRLVLLLLVR